MEQSAADIRRLEYLIWDPPLRALTVFALPIILGSIFQQVYNIADSVILGRFVGQNALAAVGASASLTNVFICIAVGAGSGASVLVSRRLGERDYERMKRAVWTSLSFFLVLSIALGAAGLFLGGPIMRVLHTPEDVIDLSVLYLQVYFAGFPFLFLYNVLSSMYNAIGKSRTAHPPFYIIDDCHMLLFSHHFKGRTRFDGYPVDFRLHALEMHIIHQRFLCIGQGNLLIKVIGNRS